MKKKPWKDSCDKDPEMKCSGCGKCKPAGYGVLNGVVMERTTCIGCSNEFDDYRLESEKPDPHPICGDCEKTMEP